MNKFDVIVIGGGHAGCEAAAASARAGAKTALITIKKENLGELSCNPAMGGIGKGQIIKEIDACGGVIGEATDLATIHFKTLNETKGAAVWGPRSQIDRALYKKAMGAILNNYQNLEIIEDYVLDIEIDNYTVQSVIGKKNQYISNNVILTTGTFLKGLIKIGDKSIPAGRVDEDPCNELSKRLLDIGFELGRLKTGTPARILKDSIDFSVLEKQQGDKVPKYFSARSSNISMPQLDCYITYTNEKTHDVVRNNKHFSPVFRGEVDGLGPRYCPSIEDKIKRFGHKEKHQIFLEPEGLDSNLIYPNGISTSLPEEIQIEFLRTIKGLENCKIKRPGYVIEYDFILPYQLNNTLETQKVEGLFFAGQINGTTGYEEAAGQGLIAGVNAAFKSKYLNKEFTLSRSEAYIGVMIDDLIRTDLKEPYRMFTSRAEYRLTLRADNADQRLTPKAIDNNLITEIQIKLFNSKLQQIEELKNELYHKTITPHKLLNQYNIKITQDGKVKTAYKLLSYQEINWSVIEKIWPELIDYNSEIKELIEIESVYESYLYRQNKDINIFSSDENIKIPYNLDYNMVKSLSNEAKEKFIKFKPQTIGAASRIQGITPASLSAVLVFIKKMYQDA